MKPYSDSEIQSINRSLEDGIEPQRGGIDPYDLARWLSTVNALTARIARLEEALRPFAAMDFAGSIYAEYVGLGDAPETVVVLCAYADGKPSGVNVTMADFAKARAALEEKP